MAFLPINYSHLNSRQQENYNFHKVSSVLADYGFTTLRLSDDWQGTDFIAQHIDGTFLKVQLKGRLSLGKKYMGKNIWICFRTMSGCCLYPHDEAVEAIQVITPYQHTESWLSNGAYSFPNPSGDIMSFIQANEIKNKG